MAVPAARRWARVHADLRERRAAGEGRQRADRRPAGRQREGDLADLQQPGGGEDQRRRAVRAAARRHRGGHPAHVAVGHRQPLRRALAGAGDERRARRRRDARYVEDHHRGRPRPALQFARPEGAQGPPGADQGLLDAVRGQGAGGRRLDEVLQPAALERAAAGERRDRRRGRPDALPRLLLAHGHDGRGEARRPVRAGRQRGRDHRRDRVGEPRAVGGAGAAADHVAAREQHVREPARDARRPRPARRRVEGRDQGPGAVPARAAPAGARRQADDRRPLDARSPPRARQRPGRGDAQAARLPAGRQPGVQERDRRAEEEPAGARVRAPVHPGARRLVPRLRRRRCPLRRHRPLRAHPADLPRVPVPRPAGRADAGAAAGLPAARRPAAVHAAPLPGLGEPDPARQVGAVPRLQRKSRLRPDPGAAGAMRRAIPIIVVFAVIVVAIVVIATRGSAPPYEVRAIFDNAGFVIPGEDVKIAGVKVGVISDLDVTDDDKAAVVMRIDEPGYRDFRRDASCIVRPQSLIGERFVECTPTQPRAAGTAAPPPLRRIDDGAGKGQYLLPVTNTQQTVDIDLIGDVMRQPERERLSLILNELGTGLAGRGRDLNDVIRRADPALQQTDRVLRILARQNQVLNELAVNSDTVLQPLARERSHVAGAIRHSSEVAKATAERRGDLEADIQTLPRFLDELEPTMQALGSLSDQMTPLLTDLHSVAPEVNQVIERTGPFATAAIPSFESLGDAAKTGIPAVTDARPVIADVRSLAKAVRPVGATAADVLESFQKTQGIERLMDYIFYQTTAINGFDALGHYLRAELIVNQCVNYAVRPVNGCSSNFSQSGAAASSAPVASVASAAGDDPVLQRTAVALAKALGQVVEKEKRKHKAKAKAKPRKHAIKHAKRKHSKHEAAAPTPGPDSGVTTSPTGALPTPTAAAPAPPATAPAETPTPTPTESGAGDALLDYLFGGDG